MALEPSRATDAAMGNGCPLSRDRAHGTVRVRPMSQSPAALSADEFVLRRIHKNHGDAGPPVVFGFTTFRPTPEDTSGLSVFREKSVSAAELAFSGRKPGEYFVVRMAEFAGQNVAFEATS